MRTILLAICLTLMLATVGYAKELKIGVIDMGKVLETCEPGKKVSEKLTAKRDAFMNDLKAQEKEISALREEMKRQNLVLSQEAKADKEILFKRKVRDFQDASATYQRTFANERDAALKPVIELIREVLKGYGEKNNFNMLLDNMFNGMLFYDEGVDVTNEIIVEVNKAWRAKKK